MKNFFGINVENGQMECPLLLVREAPHELQEEVKRVNQESVEMMKNLRTPKWLNICYFLSLYFGVFVLLLWLQFLFSYSFKDAVMIGYKFLVIGFGLIIIAVVLSIYRRMLAKRLRESDEVKNFTKKVEDLVDVIRKSLNVPEDKIQMDVFNFPYLIKEGSLTRPSNLFAFITTEVSVFRENNNLCFSDVNHVFSIPMDAIFNIMEVKEQVGALGWNKKEKYNSKTYKEYNLTMTKGIVKYQSYYTIQFKINGDDYEITIPPYEIENIRKLTNININE